MLAQAVRKEVAVLAIDAAQIGLARHVHDANTLLLLQPVSGRKGDAEALAIERLRLQRIEKYGAGSEKLSNLQLELLEEEPGVSQAEAEAES